MNRRTLVAATLLVLGPLPCPPAAARPRIVLAWNTLGTTAQYQARTARAAGLTHVSPTWWRLGPGGVVDDRSDRRFSDWARARGLEVWPLFGNATDPEASRTVLRNPALRAAVASRVADLAVGAGATGVNLDWENLHEEDRDAFSTFVAEAAGVWRARGLTVSVDVTPQTPTWSLGNWSTSFDRAAIGAAADLVVLMAYDQHNRLRPNGPTASLPWVEDGLASILREVPAPKVILGVPLYTRDWSDDPRRPMDTLPMTAAAERVRRYGATIRWDEAAGTNLAEYTRDGHVHRMWLEDERSLALKTALVDRHGLAGVAAWRLGFEPPSAWRAITGPRAPPPTVAPTPAPTPEPTPTPTLTPTRAPTKEPTPVRVAAAPTSAPHRPIGAAAVGVFAAGLTLAFARRSANKKKAGGPGTGPPAGGCGEGIA